MITSVEKATQYVQIGLEYEGVIVDANNDVAIFSELPYSVRRNITGRCEKNEHCEYSPVDRYGCLAEIRTPPQSFCIPTTDDRVSLDIRRGQSTVLIEKLFNAIYYLDGIFRDNNYCIRWEECKIPQETHLAVIEQSDKEFRIMPDIMCVKKIHTIKNGKPIQWRSHDNLLRGGGLHINISGIESAITPQAVVKLYNRMHQLCPQMKSAYRTSPLFREKYIDSQYVFEFMSFGTEMRVPHTICEAYSLMAHQIHWAEAILYWVGQCANNIHNQIPLHILTKEN